MAIFFSYPTCSQYLLPRKGRPSEFRHNILYAKISNTVIGTLAVDGLAVTFGIVRRGLAPPAQNVICNVTNDINVVLVGLLDFNQMCENCQKHGRYLFLCY